MRGTVTHLPKQKVKGPYYAVWTPVMGALIGVGTAIAAGVHAVPNSAAEVSAGLVVAIVFSSRSWGPELFLPGIDASEVTPMLLTRFVSVFVNLPLMALWAVSPVIAMAVEGCRGDLIVGVLFASVGSASCYALMAGMAGGILSRLERTAPE